MIIQIDRKGQPGLERIDLVAELVAMPKSTDGDNSAFAPGIGEAPSKSKFKILETLKGAEHLKKAKEVEAIYFGDAPVGTQFMITAIDPKDLAWATPIPLPKEGREYLSKIMKLPETGADRLVFFENYLENPDQMLSREVVDGHLRHPPLLQWRDRVRTVAIVPPVPCLHFHKHDRLAIARDAIQFSAAPAVAPGNNCVPALLELHAREIFAGFPKSDAGLRHASPA